MISLVDVYQRFHHWLHDPVSTASVGAFRIALGGLVLVSALVMAPDWLAWFGPDGLYPSRPSSSGAGLGAQLIRWWPATEVGAWAFWGLHVASAVALTVGFGTRLAAAGCFLTLTMMQHQGLWLFGGADIVMRMMTLWLAFSQAGAAYSVDRWLRIRRGKEPAGPPPDADPWAQRLMQLQLAIVYGVTTLAKLDGATWLNGTAVYYALRLTEYQGLPLPGGFYTPWASALMTYGTLVVEAAIATLIWFHETRMAVVLATLILHLGLLWSFSLFQFEMVMIACLIVWVDPRLVWGALRRRRFPDSSAAL